MVVTTHPHWRNSSHKKWWTMSMIAFVEVWQKSRDIWHTLNEMRHKRIKAVFVDRKDSEINEPEGPN
jgi:hypothetical protein